MLTPSFFEGTEKKVEAVVDPAAGSLRALGEPFWGRLVAASGARILSHIGNESLDAWLLSESSLFVWDDKMVLITCGRTRLTASVRELLRQVPSQLVRFFAYERKNEVFPRAQPSSFREDARELAELMPGRAFQFANKDEHHLDLFCLDRPYEPAGQDTTLQVLMHGLDAGARRLFGPDSGLAADEVAAATGLEGLLEGALRDAHLFRPRGYSLNAIRQAHYATVHVTPEEGSSYASFESNLPLGHDPDERIARLLEVFRPRSFDLVRWERRAPRQVAPVADERRWPGGFQVGSCVAGELSCGYHVQFVHLFRPGGPARSAYELALGQPSAVDQETS